MTWDAYINPLDTTDMTTGTDVFLKMKTSKNCVIQTVRTWFEFFNDPSHTGITMEFYSVDQAGLPKKLIATSTNTIARTDIQSASDWTAKPYARSEVFFNFDDIVLRQEDFYAFIPRATGYTFSEASYIAWVKGWPNNVYDDDLTLETVKIHVNPFTFSVPNGYEL